MSEVNQSILVADDHEHIRNDLARILKPLGCRLIFASTGKETLLQVERERPDLVLLDLNFPDSKDLGLLKRIRAVSPNTEIIMVSGETDDISIVVEAIKLGSFDFVAKPIVADELLNRIRKAFDLQGMRRSQSFLLKQLRERDGVDSLVGAAPVFLQAFETIKKLADTDGCVLVRGESGTGKELAARALHHFGKRADRPFIVVNCAAIPEQLVESVLFGHRRGAFTGAIESVKGRFEAAGTGTIFLDEIGDMQLAQQASLLRVLEYRRFTPVGDTAEKECKARFVLATNRDLKQCIADGKFREDLFYRINVATITMPPLRARADDIEMLANYYCDRLTAEMGHLPMRLNPDAAGLLKQYDWPGNVRELKNVIESVIMLSPAEKVEIGLSDLPPELLASKQLAEGAARITDTDRFEKQELIRALRATNGNQSHAAKMLGWHRNTVRMKIRQFGLLT